MNELLHKYWEGNTSLEEEQQLRDYFVSNDVAAEHEVYRSIFNTFEDETAMTTDLNFNAFAKLLPPEKVKNHSRVKVLKGLGIAAGFAVLIGLGSMYMGKEKTTTDLGTYEDPKEAYYATVQALQLVSTKFNNGRTNLKPLEEVNIKTDKVFKAKK